VTSVTTVKRYTTRFLKTVALIYMAFPMTYMVFAALLFDIPAKACVSILLSPFYYLISFAAVVSGYGLWEMRRWGWYVFVLANLMIGYGNAVLLTDHGTTHHKVLAFGFSLVALLGVVYRVSREVRVPYFLPRIRWWESNPRYRLIVPCKLARSGGETIDAEILDLSSTGAFIKIKSDVDQDETLSIAFTVFGEPLEFKGIVVWRTQSTVTHPRGIGLKFTAVPKIQRKALKAADHRLKKIASLYRSYRYLMNQEEFLRRLSELQTEKLRLPIPKASKAERRA
jgi:hypothetical protein